MKSTITTSLSAERLMSGAASHRSADAAMAVGSIGMGGYAGGICDVLMNQRNRSGARGRLAMVYEPNVNQFAKRAEALRASGVTVTSRLDELLDSDVKAVWIPLPIHLHRAFTEKVLRAGKAALCEKPAAATVDDLDAMIELRDQLNIPLGFGFQDLYDPATTAIKRQLVSGAIGNVVSATVTGSWPRDDVYYSRTSWAGKLRVGDAWVLDSPACNAMAHFIHLALFLLGPSLKESAVPIVVRAEVYRAAAIDNYDTCAIRVTIAGGVQLLILLTHACVETRQPQITLKGQHGQLVWNAYSDAALIRNDITIRYPVSSQPVTQVLDGFCNHIGGESDGLIATAEMARPHVLVVNGVSQASSIHLIEDRYIETTLGPRGGVVRAIQKIDAIFQTCVQARALPSELGNVEWAKPATECDLRDYSHFAGLPKQL